jgi:hypothetical protein
MAGSDDDDTAEGGNCLNGTIVRQSYGRPCDWHPAHRPGVMNVKASAEICARMLSRVLSTSMIADDNGTGGGGGGWGGNTTGSACLMTRTTTATTNMTTTLRRMGKGRTVCRQWGETDNDGCDIVRMPSVGGMGQRMLIVTPHAAAVDPPPQVHPLPQEAARH